MIYLKKILKYLACVGISMIFCMLFILIFDGKGGVLVTPNGEVDIPIYFSGGWIVYQFYINKIHQQDIGYYWMIVKVTMQAVSILFILLFIMLSVIK